MNLSIIVPVYNVSDYLAKCLDSLLAQDLPQNEYEIIVVNDGSTDKSEDIAQQYADKYENITLINQENQGLSGARNTGIKYAKGEYIQFVDSDDFLEKNVLGGLIKQIKEDKLDVLRYNYHNINANGDIFVPFKSGKPYVDYTNIVVKGEEFLQDRLGYGCYAWQFIIKTNMLTMNKCFFKEGIYFEDTQWTPRMLLLANRVSSTEVVVYNYLWRIGSITLPNNEHKVKKILDDKISLIKDLRLQQTQYGCELWYKWLIDMTVMSILSIVSNNYRKYKLYLSTLQEIKSFPISYYRFHGYVKIRIFFINISPKLYCLLLYLKGLTI